MLRPVLRKFAASRMCVVPPSMPQHPVAACGTRVDTWHVIGLQCPHESLAAQFSILAVSIKSHFAYQIESESNSDLA
jgi:hypothetical protein